MAITNRTSDRCKRLAYDMVVLAARLRVEEFHAEAEAINLARQQINWAADSLYSKFNN